MILFRIGLKPWFLLGPDRSRRGTAHLALVHDRQAFFLPIANSTEGTCRLVSSGLEFRCGALRAPSSLSVENDLGVLRNVFHPGVELGHRDVNRARDRPVLFEFPVFANVNQK